MHRSLYSFSSMVFLAYGLFAESKDENHFVLFENYDTGKPHKLIDYIQKRQERLPSLDWYDGTIGSEYSA